MASPRNWRFPGRIRARCPRAFQVDLVIVPGEDWCDGGYLAWVPPVQEDLPDGGLDVLVEAAEQDPVIQEEVVGPLLGECPLELAFDIPPRQVEGLGTSLKILRTSRNCSAVIDPSPFSMQESQAWDTPRSPARWSWEMRRCVRTSRILCPICFLRSAFQVFFITSPMISSIHL